MNKQLPVIIATAAGAVLILGIWMAAPILKSPTMTVDKEVEQASEKARRLLEQYEWSFEVGQRKGEQTGVASELNAEKLNALAESDGQQMVANVEAQSDKLKEYSRTSRSAVQDLDERLKKLDPDAELRAHPSQAFSANAPGLASDMAKGVADRDKLVQQSNRATSSALAAINEGLAASSGDVNGSDSLLGNRLKGIALQQQGLAEHRAAAVLRLEANDALHGLSAVAEPLDRLRRESRIVETSDIEATISRQQQAVAEAESKEAKEKAALEDLKSRMAQLQTEIQQEIARADEARANMDAIEKKGLDYGKADSVAQFKSDYMKQADIYREASAKAQALQFGTLKNAQIDASGDYLTGKFVSATAGGSVENIAGLDELERELSLCETTVQNAGQQTAEAKSTLASLQKIQERYAARATEAQTTLQSASAAVQAAFDLYTQKAAAAVEAEDKALGTLKQAAASFKRAQQRADARVNDVPADLSPAAMEISHYKLVQEDRWLPAELKCQAADAQLWTGMILYDRYSHLKEAQAALDRVATLASLTNYDATALASAATDAKTQGEEAVTDAIDAYEGAAAGLKKHWTVAASAAAADYLLALFDHPEMVNVALANYKAVVEGREDNALVRPFRDRFEQLRTR